MRKCYCIVHSDYDIYDVVCIFSSIDRAQKILDEVDLTPTGRRRGYYTIDEYPFNALTFKEAQNAN